MSLHTLWKLRAQSALKPPSEIADLEHWLITRHHRYRNAVCIEFTSTKGEPACIVATDGAGARIEWCEWKDGEGKPFQCAACAAHWRNYTGAVTPCA